jgi:hypothetical protein
LPLREIVALVAAIAAARHRWETWEKWEPFRPVDFPNSPISRKIISRARVGWPKGFPCFPGFPRPEPPIPRKPAEIMQIPTEAGRGFRFDVGQRSDLKPATIPI